jgi:tRNA 2-(methylsulfanyl)-N6-isopentenyladenosine37 hydroxylase
MLGLKVATHPGWAAAAAADPDRVLVDHAHCEKKAASSALALISRYPTRRALVAKLLELAREELDHFGRVIATLHARGRELAADRPDPYVRRLKDLVRAGEPGHLLDLLLVSALIEARSCERFSILAATSKDPALASLYRELMASEATHFAIFADLARDEVGKEAARARLEELYDLEAGIVRELGNEASMHG